MNQEQVASLKAKYSGRRLVRLTSAAADVVALSPNYAEVAELKAIIDDKARAGTGMEWLVRKCVVADARKCVPLDAGALDELLSRKPVLVECWFKHLRDAAGAAEVVAVHPAAGFEADYPGREVVTLASASASVKAKVPGMTEMRELRRRNQADEREVVIAEWLTRSCVVEPDTAGVNAILDRKPLLLEKWFQALLNAGGASEQVEVGEL